MRHVLSAASEPRAHAQALAFSGALITAEFANERDAKANTHANWARRVPPDDDVLKSGTVAGRRRFSFREKECQLPGSLRSHLRCGGTIRMSNDRDPNVGAAIRSVASLQTARRTSRSANLALIRGLRTELDSKQSTTPAAWKASVKRARVEARKAHQSELTAVASMARELQQRQNPLKITLTAELKRDVDRAVLFHLAAAGKMRAAEALLREGGFRDDVRLDEFDRMHAIKGNLESMAEWAESRCQIRVEARELLMNVRAAQFESLEGDPQAMVAFAQRHLKSFHDTHRDHVRALMMRTLVPPSDDDENETRAKRRRTFATVASQFECTFRLLNGLPAESHSFVSELLQRGAGAYHDGDEFFSDARPRHSVFVCPISRVVDDQPLMLECGHVLGEYACRRVASRQRVQCPTCPTSTSLSDVVRLKLA